MNRKAHLCPKHLLYIVMMFRLYILQLVLYLILCAEFSNALAGIPSKPQRLGSRPVSHRNRHGEQKLKIGSALRRHFGVVLVDVENVRGKSGFGLSHNDLLHSLSEWTQQCRLTGQVIMMVDHGKSADAYWVPAQEEEGEVLGEELPAIAVVFAGPVLKADDILARDIGKITRWAQAWAQGYDSNMQQGKTDENNTAKAVPIMVVTDDQGLLSRCRKSTAKKHLQVVSPLSLLEELEQLKNTDRTLEHSSTRVRAALDEILLGAEYLQAQLKVQASLKKHIPNKRRKALRQKATDLQHKLERTDVGQDIFKFASTAINVDYTDVIEILPAVTDKMGAMQSTLHSEIQSALMAEWATLRKDVRNRSYQKEKTEDRILLAECFRQGLVQQHNQHTTDLCNRTGMQFPPAQTYVRDWIWTHAPAQDGQTSNNPSCATLRVVVISDTHGYERQLGALPPGDLLLHLGDFALEGPAQSLSLKTFDQWLALQPHRYKIVLRGNHDPHRVVFEASGATYVTSPKTIRMAGYSLALVPHVSRLTTRCLPNRCDVVALHVPPKGVLDDCQTGKSAGCNTLRRRLQQMAKHNMGKGPPIVLCGHIHESRGQVWHTFAGLKTDAISNNSDGASLVVNVANANSGIAKGIEYGPTVVDLSRQQQEISETRVSIQMAETGIDGGYVWTKMGRSEQRVYSFDNDTSGDVMSDLALLLVIRLGLKSGVSLYNSHGELVRYEQLHFKSLDDLKRRAMGIMLSWERDTMDGPDLPSPKQQLAYIALEGGDPALREAWVEAATSTTASQQQQKLIFLDPNEWRKNMLTVKERTNSRTSRAAARDLAYQIVAENGTDDLEEASKLPVEVAEAIVAGLHVTKRLGWSNPQDQSATFADNPLLSSSGTLV